MSTRVHWPLQSRAPIELTRRRELVEPPREELLLRRVARQIERPTVGVARLLDAAEPAQEVGPSGVEQVVALQPVDALDQGEPLLGSPGLGRPRPRG